MSIRNLVKAAAFFLLASTATPSWAWDGTITGTVGLTEITGHFNYDYRVHINGQAGSSCGAGTGNWGFINSNESNYNTYVAALLAAKMSKTPVTLYLIREGAYCRIGHMAF